MTAMTAGRLRKRVTYQTWAKSLGPQRQPVWGLEATHGPFWAEVRPADGREAFHAQQIRAEVSLVVTIRYPGFLPAADPVGRLVYTDPASRLTRNLKISAVLDDGERHTWLKLYCTEITEPRQ